MKPRTLMSICSGRGGTFLICGDTCSATLCNEVIPHHIPKEQVLRFIKILLAREDYYVKGNR
jgi:hypothetical protein